MSKTLIAINTLTSVQSQAYASHMNLAFRMAKDCPGDEFLLFNGYRTGIDTFRNLAGRIALQNECDYLLFLDDDVLVPRDVYKRLKDRDVDIVTPFVFIRGYPFRPMFFKSILSDDKKTCGLTPYEDWSEVVEATKNPLLEVAAIGFSCCLIKTWVLKKIQPAWFITGTGHTEDVYFCVKAKQALQGKVRIYVDTTLDTGHMLDCEFVSLQTVESLRHFHEELNPSLKDGREGDNSANYLSKQREALNKLGYANEVLERENLRLNEA